MGLYELNLLNDTLNILNQGYYYKNNQKIKQFSNKNELNLFFFKMKIFSDIKKNNEKN